MKCKNLSKAMILVVVFFMISASAVSFAKTETATLAGGCFWCMFPPFAKQLGIVKVTAGYTGGTKENPTYEEVSSGKTGHVEAVEIVYDPAKLSYEKILGKFWKSNDPTDPNGQFVDNGPQYRSVIFYHGAEQKRIAEKSKADLEKSKRFDKKIVTAIKPAAKFYPAEEYHQNFYKKSPARYNSYHNFSGRDEFFKKYWGSSEPE